MASERIGKRKSTQWNQIGQPIPLRQTLASPLLRSRLPRLPVEGSSSARTTIDPPSGCAPGRHLSTGRTSTRQRPGSPRGSRPRRSACPLGSLCRRRVLPRLLRPVLVLRSVVRLLRTVGLSAALSLPLLPDGSGRLAAARSQAAGGRSVCRRLLRRHRRRFRRCVPAAAGHAGRARDRAVPRWLSVGPAEGDGQSAKYVQAEIHNGTARRGRAAGAATTAGESAAASRRSGVSGRSGATESAAGPRTGPPSAPIAATGARAAAAG